jgi:hypothetical protein
MTRRDQASKITSEIDEAARYPNVRDDPPQIRAGENEAANQVGKDWPS